MNGVRAYDRIRGTVAEHGPGQVAFGRFVFVPGGHAHALNGRPVCAGDYLVSDDEWRRRSEAGGEGQPGGPRPQSLPDDLTIEWARTIGRDLDALAARSAPLAQLQRLSPILDDEQARAILARQPLEAAIEEHFRYLAAVCFRPAARLRPIDVMLPVSAARRITPRTVARLAARSEDWAHRTPDGVRPERVLAPLREIDYDLYENRVAARLVNHLSRYLDARIAAVNGMEDWILGVEHYLGQVQGRSWRVSPRLWRMLEQLVQTERWAERVEARRAELEGLRRSVQSLHASPLWSGVNRRAGLDTALRITNLFVNDDRYRHVETLWRAWVAAEVHAQSADERVRRLQEWCRGFAAYAALLLSRAFEEVGLEALPGQQVPAPDRATVYRTGNAEVTMRWEREDVLVVERDGTKVLRVVPLPHPLTVSRQAETVATELDALGTTESGAPTLLLYPGARAEREELPVAIRLRAFEGLGSPAPGRTPGGPFATPVSALEIDSVGRVARAVRWAIWGPRLAEYPVRVETVGVRAAELAASTSYLRAEGSGVVLKKVPGDDELRALHERVFRLQRDTARFMRRGDNTEQIAQLWQRLVDATERTRGLTWCPVCGRQVSSPERALQPRDDGTYTCTCDRCRSAWESRKCRTCGATHAVLLVSVDVDDELKAHGDRLDELFAGDLLAAPCWTRARVYVCPVCANCPEAGSKDSVRCTRCNTAG